MRRLNAVTGLGRVQAEPAAVIGREELRIVRFLYGVTAVLIPAYGWIHHRLEPEARELPAERLAIAGLLTVAMALSWVPGMSRHNRRVLHGAYYGFTAWTVRILALNRFAPTYVIDGFMVIAIISMGFQSRARLAAYLGTTVALFLLAGAMVPTTAIDGRFVLADFSTLSVFLLLMGWRWMGVRDRLEESEELRHLLIDQSTEALVVIDPIRREGLEWNRRARELLGLDDGAPARSVAARVFGQPEWRDFDAVMVMKEVAMLGAYRRRGEYALPGGRRFHANLTVANVRLGRRLVLLARLAEES